MTLLSWSEMDVELQEKAIAYIIKANDDPMERGEAALKHYLLGPNYDQGRDLYFLMDGQRIIGSMGLVMLEIPTKDEAFIVELRAREATENQQEFMIKSGISACKDMGAAKVIIGLKTSHKYMDRVLSNIGLSSDYNLVMLEKKEKTTYKTKGKLISVTKDSAMEYAMIMTDAFLNSPNGATVTEHDVLDQLKAKEMIYTYTCDGRVVGGTEIRLGSGTGWIESLGILSFQQNKGYGKDMFRLVQNTLWQADIRQSKMTVMDNNPHAYKMYLDHGYEVSQVLSSWYSLTY